MIFGEETANSLIWHMQMVNREHFTKRRSIDLEIELYPEKMRNHGRTLGDKNRKDKIRFVF